MHYFRRYFLLSDHVNSNVRIPNWRISALRIILAAGVILCFAVLCDTLNAAIEFNLIHVIVLCASFFVTMAILLLASRKCFTLCAHALLLSIVAATISINLFLTDINLAKIGSMYMYACPIIALMLPEFIMQVHH